MPMPPKLAAAADRIDQQMDKAVQAATPTVKASAQVLNMVVNALNELLPLFGAPPYPAFNAPLQREPLPADFVKALGMIQAAAQAADVPAPSLMVKDDSDLKVLAGELALLARDKDFTRYLKSRPEGEDTMDEPSVNNGVMAQEAASSPSDDMALFASRMG